MSRQKVLIIIAVVVVVVVVGGYLIAKYTTWGMPTRINRLHDQIEKRYTELQQTYTADEARTMLVSELQQNRLIENAAFSGDKLELCYVNQACEDFYVGIED